MSNDTDKLVEVPAYEASNYGQILTILGMEEEGDPVAEISTMRLELEAARIDNANLRTALRFYARGEHYNTDPAEEFDTVSGEPGNWLYSGLEDSTTGIEDGGIASLALRGEFLNFQADGEDFTPDPIDGERPFTPQPIDKAA